LQKKYSNVVGIFETSAATGAGIEELKATIIEQVNNLPHVHDLLPKSWFTVKTKLEGLGQKSNFIAHDKYLELCVENEINDEVSQRTLIGFLHDLGVILYFQEDYRLAELGILNPQWVTNGVYKIINSDKVFKNKGVLTAAMLDEILNYPEYPRSKRLSIVDLMKRFELCFEIESDKAFLVPDLLPKDKPNELKFIGAPVFEYAYPVFTSKIITRFIVRMNQKIDDGIVWRTGVLLKIGENRALVKADTEDRKITIAIDGLEHTRRDALTAIRYQLDEIHASIKGLDPQKRVPIPNAPNAEPIEYDYLLLLEREGQETHLVKDGTRLVKVNIREILSGIESESQVKERGSNVTNIYVGGNVRGNIIAGDDNVAENLSDTLHPS
jgi:internalin A